MRVRRRTVWFMTLLSLVAVISVYYLVDPAKQFNGLTILQMIHCNKQLSQVLQIRRQQMI